jgi:glycosyltransferase involved in cell wall biosynthesis
MFKSKKKILLIGDLPGWAFDNIITFVKTNLNKDYNFYYDYTIYNPAKRTTGEINIQDSLNTEFLSKEYRKTYKIYRYPVLGKVSYKLISVLNRFGILSRDANGKKRRVRKDNFYDCIVYMDFYMDRDGDFHHVEARKVVRGIYTDSFPPMGYQVSESNPRDFLHNYFEETDALLAGSNSILKFYEPFSDLPCFEANLAYNESIFRPRHNSKKRGGNKLVLGWTGNPNRSFKGYYELIVPVVRELQNEGLEIELRSQFSGTLNSLADFWQEVDLAIIASEADAGPSLFMEASLCGVPSLSTRIGIPAYIIKEDVNGLFFERNIDSLKLAIKSVYFDRDKLKTWSSNIRNSYLIKLGHDVQVKNWRVLFSEVLNDA